MNVIRPPVLLVTVRPAAAALTVSYRVSNVTGDEWGVFTRLPEKATDGSLKLSADTAFVEVADGRLRVEKGILDVPDGLKVAVRSAPFVSRLAAGQEWQEDIRLPLPLKVSHPYRRALVVATAPGGSAVVPQEPVMVREVEVVIGVFPVMPDVNLRPVSPATPTLFVVYPPGVAADRQVQLRQKVKLPDELLALDYGVVKPK